ncbi:MAG: hypothetical protein EAZ62_05210 [Sphingobacteriia bacterium]|nr:MAG: hypothetical protein EAZ62_05210 [Sphingobacteriia bacterium]
MIGLVVGWAACTSAPDPSHPDGATKTASGNTVGQTKISGAIACTNEMMPEDSTLYVKGGALDFEATVLNELPAPPTWLWCRVGCTAWGQPIP